MTKYEALVRLNPNCRRNLNCPQLNRKSQKTAVVSQPSAGDEVEKIIHQKDLQHLKTVQRLLLAHQTQLAYLPRLPQLKIHHQMLRRTTMRIPNLESHWPVNLLPQQPGHSHCSKSYLPLLPHPLRRKSHNNSLSTRSRARPTGQRTKNEYLQKLPGKR